MANRDTATADYSVTLHGSINLVHLLTDAARAWVDEHVDSEAQFWAGALVVESRYLVDLIDGMREGGLLSTTDLTTEETKR